MTDILEKFNVFSEISEQFKQNIELFHVFDDLKGKNALIVTKDDKVFAFGSNYSGKCGFGHNKQVETPQEIPELNGQQIIQFFIGSVFVLALNVKNQVFGWGHNDYGQLGRGYHSKDHLKPEVITDLENIIEISCGSNHSLALNRDGIVFSWGNNYLGQIGYQQQYGNKIKTPVQLKSLPKIKSIYCSYYTSFAVTFDGFVYSWGYNGLYYLGNESPDNLFEPKLINGLNSVTTVGFSRYDTYFLTNEGNIYFCGEIQSDQDQYQKTPKILDTDLKFQSLQTIDYYSNDTCHSKAMVSNKESVYYLNRNSIIKTEYKSLSDYSNEIQMTFKTVMILNECDSYKQFKEIDELGSGAFGKVIKVMNKRDDQIFAIKIIGIQSKGVNKIQTEARVMSKCSEEFVVKYYNSWTENNLFYIKMELFDNNLENIISEKKKCFNRQPMEAMTTTEYFISSQLLKEILECVQYLHQLKPEIIHRDLKPQNILVSYEPRNRRFLKLADFGLATFGSEQTISHSMWTGSRDYMAPEVRSGGFGRAKYSSKVDVYSLGQIICVIFDFEINSSDQSIRNNTELKEKWDELDSLIEQMCNLRYQKRPTCSQILENSKSWLIDKGQVENRLDLVSNSKFFNNFFLSKTVFG